MGLKIKPSLFTFDRVKNIKFVGGGLEKKFLCCQLQAERKLENELDLFICEIFITATPLYS